MQDDKFKRQLLPPEERPFYGDTLRRWVGYALILCGQKNVYMRKGKWRAFVDTMFPFEYSCSACKTYIPVPKPSRLLEQHGTLHKARLEILRIATVLAREATVEDEQYIQCLMRIEKACADEAG
jgi:hypothetical protein